MNDSIKKEEYLNTLLHGSGMIISIIGLVILIGIDFNRGSGAELASLIIYGGAVVLLYLCSTLLHYSKFKGVSPKSEHIFSVCDHSAIYLLIAGSYTPYIVFILPPAEALFWLCLIWGVACFGVVYQFFFMGRFQHFSTIIYIVMGWLIVFFFAPVRLFLSDESLLLLFLGGLSYTGGTIFFSIRKPFMHTIWHLFVMMGTAFIYFSVILLIVQ
ncbi:MAG: PAQR family membrane homeostasis protein TrhA [Culicoidibacterales bacterium]